MIRAPSFSCHYFGFSVLFCVEHFFGAFFCATRKRKPLINMVRVCAVEGCLSSDQTHLSHRFPKNLARAKEWQDALELQDKDIDAMLEKYTVCTLHFEKKDYRNIESRHLNKTALPKLITSFWRPPKREKTYEITVGKIDTADKNSLHVNIVNSRRSVETIHQDLIINEESDEEPPQQHLCRTIKHIEKIDVLRKIESDKQEEYYIVVESEDTNDDASEKRKASESPVQKTKKSRHEDQEHSDIEEVKEEDEYDFIEPTEMIYRDNCTQTEEINEDDKIDKEILDSGYWEYSKEDLIRIVLDRDQECKELKKKLDDFRHAKEKMLQSIELMKMM